MRSLRSGCTPIGLVSLQERKTDRGTDGTYKSSREASEDTKPLTTPSSWISSLQNCETINVLLMTEKMKKNQATGPGLAVYSLIPDRVRPRVKPAFSKPPQNRPTTQIPEGLSNSVLVTQPVSPCVCFPCCTEQFIQLDFPEGGGLCLEALVLPKLATHFVWFMVRSEKAGTFCWLCSLAYLHYLHRARHGFSDQSHTFVESLKEALLPQ